MAEWSREEIKSLIIKTIREYPAGYLSGSEATRKETTLSTLDFDERSARARKRSNFRRPLPIADWRDRYEAWARPHPPKGHEDLLADANAMITRLADSMRHYQMLAESAVAANEELKIRVNNVAELYEMMLPPMGEP